ncbi:SDR family oxidoreductase [Mycoplasmatota bacterium zrk1]
MEYKDLEFPRGTKFLVTGAAGFIGSNLVGTILSLGYEVRGLDNFSTGKKENVNEFLSFKNYNFMEGDIRDFDTCLSACTNIDYVLHQAALGSVPRSMKHPLLYQDNNINGTINMMEAARIKKVKRFVYASSSSVYGDSDNLPKREGEEGNVISPYALSKLVNEEYGKLYNSIFGLQCVGLRYFNVFGPRQNQDGFYAAVIPKFIKLLLNKMQPIIFGNGSQSRDFTFIDNVVMANILACKAKKDATGKAYNIACGKSISVNDLFAKIANTLALKISPNYMPTRAGDILNSTADLTKAEKLLGYYPIKYFEDSIGETIEYFKKDLSK